MAWKGCRTGKWYGTGLMGRTQDHSKLEVYVNQTVYRKLWLPLDENKGGPIFRKVLVTLDLVETRHKSIRLPNNTIRNPAIFYYFFDIFLLLRSTKEVTTENLSLNKWKTWPTKFSEDCKKCEKTLWGENSKVRGKFGDSKIFKPAKGMERQIRSFFLIDFDISLLTSNPNATIFLVQQWDLVAKGGVLATIFILGCDRWDCCHQNFVVAKSMMAVAISGCCRNQI